MSTASDGFVVLPVGGLGNQLFIYAAGLSLARRHDVPLYVDRSWYQQDSNRKFELDTFDFQATILDGSWKPSLASRIPHLSRVLRRLDRSLAWGRTYHERGYMFDPVVESLQPGARLSGYLQSPKYFSSIAPELRASIWATRTTSSWYRTQLSLLTSATPWIGLHIRRGDYLSETAQNFHGILDVYYYQRALNSLGSDTAAWPIVIFSEDADTANELGTFLGRDFRLAVAPKESRPIESLLLMGRSTAFVCANSSFSWWGAWLGASRCHRVVGPRPWFRAREIDDRDLLPPEWLTVGI